MTFSAKVIQAVNFTKFGGAAVMPWLSVCQGSGVGEADRGGERRGAETGFRALQNFRTGKSAKWGRKFLKTAETKNRVGAVSGLFL